jgi:hypothetical protein
MRDFAMMPGVQFQEICEALADAFDDLVVLDQMLRFRLSIKRNNIVADGPIETVVFRLLLRAEAQGWETDLIQAAFRQVPRNRKLAAVYQKYGLAPDASVQTAGAIAVPSIRATDNGFEAKVTALALVDLGVWREKLSQVETRVGRVEVNNRAMGTGFLVGPDALLTNFHVLEKVLTGGTPPAAVAVRFDYKLLADGSRSEGVQVGLHPTDWKLDDSEYSAAEKAGQPDAQPPTADELDYALVRLERAVGKAPVDAKATSGAPARGWIVVPDQATTFQPKMPLLIAQHPDGSPLKLALDTEGVIGQNANQTRVRYATNTEPGSSGSPCFDLTWGLVALHHYGDPAFGHPRYNQGVPINLIRDRLKRLGKDGALGS